MSFFEQCVNFDKRAMDKLEVTREKVAQALFVAVVNSTPVDTGRARGNWQFSLNTPATGTIDNPSLDAVLNEIYSANYGNYDDTIILTNNLPYIERLEFGYSKQAPRGMVRINVQRIAHNLRSNPNQFK